MSAKKKLLMLIIIFPLSAASAKPKALPLAESLGGDAKLAYDHARTRFGAGDFSGALTDLKRALEIAPDPRLFWNIAACENKLHHRSAALVSVEKYLTAGSGMLSDEEKIQAREFAAAVKVFVGRVFLDSPLSGIEVLVDNDLIGTTPFSQPVWIDEGARRVRFVHPGYQTLERTERVLGGSELHWTVGLQPVVAVPTSAPVISFPEKRVNPPKRWLIGPLVLGGIGVGLMAAGAALSGSSASKFSELKSACDPICAPSRYQTYAKLDWTGTILLSVGAAAIVSAVVWLIVPAKNGNRKRTALTPTFDGFIF